MKRPTSNNIAFSLIEVTLALGVIAFCLVAVLGLVPVSIKTNQSSQEQTSTANIGADVIADLYATPTTQSTSKHYAIAIPVAGGTASTTRYLNESGQWNQAPPQPTPPTAAQSDSRYGVQVRLIGPNAGTRASTVGTLFVWWPATVPLSNAAGSISSYIAIDRN